jgi:hypothetical protein
MLLPDAPLGHCLRLHSIFSRLSEREADIPRLTSWRAAAKLISTGVLDDNLFDNATLSLESTLVSSSLMLSFSVAAIMSPSLQCADGTACDTLRNADFICWALSCALFLFSVGASWLMMLALVFHRRSELASHLKTNFGLFQMGNWSFVVGLQVSNLSF